MSLPEQPPSDPSSLRASDADRDQVADRLREALAEGRISPEEHAERIEAVFAAKTYAELAPVVTDLPGAAAPAPKVDLRKEPSLPAPAPQSATMIAVFSGAERKGRWLVEPHTTITCVFGGVELDLRRAVLSQREVTININCIFGGVDITVPPGVRVIDSGANIFGGRQVPDEDPLDPDAPVIRLTGFVLFGGVDVKVRDQSPTRKEERRALHRARHAEREARRTERHTRRHSR